MKKVIYPMPHIPKRLSVAETKARFSEVIRQTEIQPTVVHRRGEDVAVVIGVEEYQKLSAGAAPGAMVAFLQRVAQLRAKYRGTEISAPRAMIRPQPVSFEDT